MHSRKMTSAGGAEIWQTYWYRLLASLMDEVENESNTFAQLQQDVKDEH